MLLLSLLLYSTALNGLIETPAQAQIERIEESTPQYLYKVLSIEDWLASQEDNHLHLSTADDDFIHFSMKDQVSRIVRKYWADVPEFVILKISTKNLPGNFVFEANPGGSSKYDHLYDGEIPIEAVEEAEILTR